MDAKFQKYEDDLIELIEQGKNLLMSLQKECLPEQFEKGYKPALGEKYDEIVKSLPRFSDKYQEWYSGSVALIRQLIPDRLVDFSRLYERPKTSRKEITHENYTIEDALVGLRVTRGWDKEIVVNVSAVIPRVEQQLAIVRSVRKRFESSLYDIKQLVQADIFDSELDAASELNANGFRRAAGAVAGVVLEEHLQVVSENHRVTVRKKNPGINDLAQALKSADVIDTPTWRKIQHLADVRNLCDHKKSVEPNADDISELITGVQKVVKNLF